MRWIAWVLAWVWALSGCTPDVPEGRFACVDSIQCPSGWSCRTDEGLCYRQASELSPDTAEGGGGERAGRVAVGMPEGKGGTGGQRPGGGGRSGDAGRAGQGGVGGSEVPASGCAQTCRGDTPFCDGMSCVECLANSAPHCDGDAPVVCEAKHWVTKPACQGKNPVCSNGTCASMRLVGGIAVTVPGAGTDKLRLVEPALEATPRACAAVKDKIYCVRGGLR